MSYQPKNYQAQGGDDWVVGGTLTASTTSTVTINGSFTLAAGSTTTIAGDITQSSGGTWTLNGTLTGAAGATVTVNGPITLAGQVTQSSGSTMTLNGTVTGAAGSAITFDNLTVTNLNIATGGRLYDNDGKWDDLMFPASAIRVPGSGGPGTAATVGTIQSLAFDAATREVIYLQAQMPHRWAKGTALYPHVHWCTTATTGGKVAWGIEYTVADIGGSFATPTTAMAADSATTTHSLTGLGTISMTGKTGPSTMVLLSLFRDSTNSSDTCTTDAHLLQFDLHYLVNSLGSSGATSQGP